MQPLEKLEGKIQELIVAAAESETSVDDEEEEDVESETAKPHIVQGSRSRKKNEPPRFERSTLCPHYVKKLMYTVKIGEPDPRFGKMLLEQFGGANGGSPRLCTTPFRGSTAKMRRGRTFSWISEQKN